MHTYTLQNVVAAFINIVSRFGSDHVAKAEDGGAGCIYFRTMDHRLAPVCIVGQYLSDLGVLRAVARKDSDGDSIVPVGDTCSLNMTQFWADIEEFGVAFTPDAKQFMREVQELQDNGSSWGAALHDGLANFRKAKESDALREVADLFHTLPYVPLPPVKEEPLADWERDLLGK